MPIKLERALRRRASKLGLGKKRSDAYVYGTLRKTGWKPSHQMDDQSRVIRLATLNRDLDSIIRFDLYGWNVRRSAELVGPGGRVRGHEYQTEKAPGIGSVVRRNLGKIALPTTGAVLGGTLGHVGWGKMGNKAGLIGAGVGALALTPAGFRSDREREQLAMARQVIPMAREDYLRAHGIIRRPAEMSAKGKPIEFADLPIANQDVLSPWQAGAEQDSKLYQVQFPADLSPAAALRLPLPQLMAFLNQRNHLQTQYSFSEKHQRLIRLSAKLDEIHAAHPTK